MSGADSSRHSQLIAEVLSGEKAELQQLAARGMLPLPPAELISLQLSLAQAEGTDAAAVARESLASTDPQLLAEVVREELEASALEWLARHHEHPLVLEAIIQRKDVAWSLLEALAPSLSADLQETLLLRQDAIIELPTILDALETNQALSSFSKRRVVEYRRHLLPTEREEQRAPEPEPAPEAIEEASEEEVATAIDEARSEPANGEVDEITGLSESQLRTLPLPVRLKLSRRAPRALRTILLRDSNASVAVAVLENNPMSDSELEQIAKSRSVIEDVLSAIARNRSWIRKYPIVVALVKNPKTQVGVAIRLAPRLSVRDLRSIAKDRNVASVVRSTAERLCKLKLS